MGSRVQLCGRLQVEGDAPMPLLLQYYGGHLMGLLNGRDELGTQASYFEKMVHEMRLPGWRAPLADLGDGFPRHRRTGGCGTGGAGRTAAVAVPRALADRRGRRADARPVAYSLALLQLSQNRLDDAIPTFEEAVERAASMRARPYVARSRAGLAEALRRRAQPGDGGRAEELAELAAADARELGMPRLQRELGERRPG